MQGAVGKMSVFSAPDASSRLAESDIKDFDGQEGCFLTTNMSILKISGTKIVNEKGEEVVLRGAGLGGWMKQVSVQRPTRPSTDLSRSMENFISGYPGCEFQIRESLAEVIGSEKSELFFDKVTQSGA
jgi:hypothetical protein